MSRSPILDRLGRVLERVPVVVVPLLLVAATGFFGWWVNQHYPIKHWLAWRYAGYWVACAFWATSCVTLGHRVVTGVLKTTLPILEHVSTSFAVGGVGFWFLMCIAGHLQLYRGWLFFALPLLMMAIGGRSALRTGRRLFRHVRHARKTSKRTDGLLTYVILAFGLIGIAMVYFLILTPDNVQFDSRWKHIALAEEFSVEGGLRRFPEGWTVATYPHLPSYFYGWAFLLPGGRLFDHVELAAHIEMTTFLGSLLATPGLVRLLIPGSRPHLAWAARFLFPGIFLYDSSLSVGADHIGAFFVIPIFTQLIRAARRLSWRHAVVLAVCITGAAMAKYTITTMIVPAVALAIGGRAVLMLVATLRGRIPQAERRAWILGPLACAATLMVCTAPHWLKNIIWYGDPAYPTLYKSLALRPWTPDSAEMFEYGYKEFQFWRPTRDWNGVKDTLKALVTFSFSPNDYGKFHGKVPVFGSLFTLLCAVLPFFGKRGARTAGLALATHASVAIWYWTHHQDRYLQAVLPWMTATTAAVLVLLWRSHAVTRVATSALVALQVAWGGDVWFIPTHAMAGSPQKRVLDLFAAGYQKNYEKRFKIYGPWSDMAPHLPKGSRVVLHDNHVHVGIHAATVNDWFGWQFGISYVRIGSPANVYETYKQMGVTHVEWLGQTSHGWDSLGGDLVFYTFVSRNLDDVKTFGSARLGKLQGAPPDPTEWNDLVTFVGCDRGGAYAPGLYRVGDMSTPVFGPNRLKFPKPTETSKDLGPLVAKSGLVVLDKQCPAAKELPEVSKEFELVARRKWIKAPRRKKELEIWLRKRATGPVPAETAAPSSGDAAPLGPGGEDEDAEGER